MIEIDGPRQDFFEYLEHGHNNKRIVYIKLGIRSDSPHHAVRYLENQLNVIRRELMKTDGSILYWGHRPQLEQDPETGTFKCTCGLATEPPLPDEFGDGLYEVKEGRVVIKIKERV